jgi:hypothetical protein
VGLCVNLALDATIVSILNMFDAHEDNAISLLWIRCDTSGAALIVDLHFGWQKQFFSDEKFRICSYRPLGGVADQK